MTTPKITFRSKATAANRHGFTSKTSYDFDGVVELWRAFYSIQYPAAKDVRSTLAALITIATLAQHSAKKREELRRALHDLDNITLAYLSQAALVVWRQGSPAETIAPGRSFLKALRAATIKLVAELALDGFTSAVHAGRPGAGMDIEFMRVLLGWWDAVHARKVDAKLPLEAKTLGRYESFPAFASAMFKRVGRQLSARQIRAVRQEADTRG